MEADNSGRLSRMKRELDDMARARAEEIGRLQHDISERDVSNHSLADFKLTSSSSLALLFRMGQAANALLQSELDHVSSLTSARVGELTREANEAESHWRRLLAERDDMIQRLQVSRWTNDRMRK